MQLDKKIELDFIKIGIEQDLKLLIKKVDSVPLKNYLVRIRKEIEQLKLT